jgi:hypothetical protein
MTVTEPTTGPTTGSPSDGSADAAPALPDSTAELLASNRPEVRVSPRWTLRRMFAVWAGLTVVLLVAAIVAGAALLHNLSDARTQLLDDIGPATRANQSLAIALLTQETAVRGFALTRDGEFVTRYRDGVATEATALGVVREHVAGSREAAQVDAVARAAQAWRSAYAEPVLAAVPGAPVPDPAAGKVLFDALRAPSAQLTTVLEEERSVARDRLNAAGDALRWTGTGIAVLVALFLAAAAWGLRRGVLGPVADLAQHVRDVVSGESNRPVRAGGPHEIAELGADIEAMRVHIAGEVDLLQEANRRLDEQARDLERSNSDLEQFAYVASHDLQEPLRKVSSFCQLLQRRYGGKLDERADQYIEFAVDGAQRMQRLINDLLAFSRVGRTTAAFERVDLREIGLAAAAQLDTTRSELGGEIVIGDLPAVQGDAALLRQLLLNLFGNGLKFHREGVAPVVRVDARKVGEAYEFAVTDNGIGIEPEYAEKIFVIFQRLHGRDVYSGTGIGLALVKKIVEFHGGRVWLDTAPNAEPGTVVRFTLPVERDAEHPADPPTDAVATAARAPQEMP